LTPEDIDYGELVDEALRGIVRRVLEEVAVDGLPGEHHFFIGFRTDAPGVEIPPSLRATYPAEMTIVLQHQFWDLVVDDEAFAVTLRFDARESRLRVPWQALYSFVDPAAEFGLRFGSEPVAETGSEDEDSDRGAGTGDVVSLDDFRRHDR
jgi:hypothetical protein